MRKTIKIILSILILMVFFIPLYVQADSFKFNATADKTKVEPGDEVVITLKLSDINAGELGINTVEAILSYDSTVFEEVTQSNFKSLNNWSLTYNGEETEQKGKILGVIISSGVTEDQTIGTITLKVKEGAKDRTTTIKLTNIATNNGQDMIKETDKTIYIEIGTEELKNPVDNTDDKKNEIIIDTNTEKINTQTNIITTDDTKAPNKIPQTGTVTYFVIVMGIFVFAIVAFIGYRKYKRIDK